MSTDVLEKPEVDIESKEDEPLAHYTDSASATEGYIMGTPVTALCGKKFVPTRNPERLKICPICQEIVDAVFFFSE